jgi:hypothetical protein
MQTPRYSVDYNGSVRDTIDGSTLCSVPKSRPPGGQRQKLEMIASACSAHKQLVAALELAKTALEISKPTHAHYEEPVALHHAALKSVREALAVAGAA